MTSLLLTVIIISGFMFIISVLLMAPKGGLGFGVGGMSTSNEYGSKKSLEGTLKKSAVLSLVFFTVSSMLYPYANRKTVVKKPSFKVESVNVSKQSANKSNNVKENKKVETKDNKPEEVKTSTNNKKQENTKK